MQINENERASILAMTKLEFKLLLVIREHMETTDPRLTYHEIIAVLLNMATTNNRNALKREYGKEDED
jgi:hypothetical protein